MNPIQTQAQNLAQNRAQNRAEDSLPSADTLQQRVELALDHARRKGATQAEASVSASRGYTVSVRNGAVESLEFQQDRDFGLTVYLGQRKGHATTGDLSDAGLLAAVDAALTIARSTGEDPCSGLADAARMARELPDLDLDHPWALDVDGAVDLALGCEAAARGVDARITGSEGASVNSHRGISVYGNTHGFIGSRVGTQHSLGCAVIASDGKGMQRDGWYSNARRAEDLMDIEALGRRAGERALARLGGRQIKTQSVPVLFPPDLARGLWGHLLAAISGGALYRRASYLLDAAGTQVCAAQISLRQRPHIPRGAASAGFDSEGVATVDRDLVHEGVLQGYLLGSYSARKLGLETTGNAGGVYNLLVEPRADAARFDFDALVRHMGRGLIVSELLGHGVNTVTGDYSRGAAGFWVEGGEIAFPVEELTIAGTLPQMFAGITALGTDIDPLKAIRTGSVLIGEMTVAGH